MADKIKWYPAPRKCPPDGWYWCQYWNQDQDQFETEYLVFVKDEHIRFPFSHGLYHWRAWHRKSFRIAGPITPPEEPL